jgi:predicted nucleotidyltransferase
MLASSPDVEEVRRIVLDRLRGHRARVYLFGSWARGAGSRISDIDVAVEALEPLPPELLSEIHEAIEESRVLYQVDLVDLSHAAPELRDRIHAEGVLWNG